MESIETEIACVITEKHHASPDGIHRQSGLCTGIAWDNYDENSETSETSESGSGTLHDTVGICYQNMNQTTEDNQNYHTDNIIIQGKLNPSDHSVQKIPYWSHIGRSKKIKTFQYEKKEVPRPLTLIHFEY